MAAASEGLEPGLPFGRSIEAIVVYLHYARAIGLKRLKRLKRLYALRGEVFDLHIVSIR